MTPRSTALLPRITLLFWLSALAVTALYLVLFSGQFFPKTTTIQLNQARHEIGHAYQAPLGTAAYSSHERPSPAVLLEDGKPLGPGNALHDSIRRLGAGRYSIWHDEVYFSASDNSDPTRNGRVYQLVAPGWNPRLRSLLRHSLTVLWLLAALLGAWLWRRQPEALPGLQKGLWWVLRFLPLALGLLLLIYLALALYALGRGEGLFLAWPLHRFAWLGAAARLEGHLPAWLVDWAVLGWLAGLLHARGAPQDPAAKAKASLAFWYTWAGLPAVIGLFALHTGHIWFAPEDMQGYALGSALGGVVPFSDALGHFQLSHLFAATGEFNSWVMRRPLAAAMRVGLNWLAGSDAFYGLGLQVALLGLSAWMLGLTLLRRWGVFAALAAVALVLTYARNFQATYLVHSLGVVWACLGAAALIEFQYDKKLATYLTGLGAVTMALLVRMGAMFLTPAFMLWVLWVYRKDWKKALTALALSVAVVSLCWAGSVFVLRVHGGESNYQGANFASIAAGLSINQNWSVATQRYADQLSGGPEEKARRLFAIALHNIGENPAILLKSLYSRAADFLDKSLDILSSGLGGQSPPLLFMILPVLALLRLWFYPRDRAAFWVLSIVAVILSAAVVYYAEGPRSMAVGYVVLEVFLASALRKGPLRPGPEARQPAAGSSSARLLEGLSLALFVFILLAPTLAYHFPPPQALAWRQRPPARLGPQEAILWGGGSLLGMVVVADDAALPAGVPAMHLSSFVDSVRRSGVETSYQRLVTPEPPNPPFAFLAAPPFKSPICLAPVEMFKRKGVLLWKVKWRNWYGGPHPNYFRYILSAEPFRPATR